LDARRAKNGPQKDTRFKGRISLPVKKRPKKQLVWCWPCIGKARKKKNRVTGGFGASASRKGGWKRGAKKKKGGTGFRSFMGGGNGGEENKPSRVKIGGKTDECVNTQRGPASPDKRGNRGVECTPIEHGKRRKLEGKKKAIPAGRGGGIRKPPFGKPDVSRLKKTGR